MFKSKNGVYFCCIESKQITTTEERLKNSARQLFIEKGYKATRTRDIAFAADTNLALLNYHFGSKQKLFEQIMNEAVRDFFHSLVVCLNNEKTTLQQKITDIVERYVDFLEVQPDLPMFVFSELRNHPDSFLATTGMSSKIMSSVFMHQLTEFLQQRNKTESPLHFFLNMLSMTVFPFVAKPVIQVIGSLDQTEFEKLIEERKKLIPVWIETLLNT